MRIMMVGGAVRDLALGRIPNDIDYLVQDASVEEFMEVYPDARQVGKDFPVFLVNGEEYAFARTERNTGTGHTDFIININKDVTIMEDLNRRDLTINALAMCPENGKLVVNQQSIEDLENKVLRHNGPAFKEDPLRVFRVARFACQLPDFTIATETIHLMINMKDHLKHLPCERVFGELEKALSTDHSHRFFEVLARADCLGYWFPEIAVLEDISAGPNKGKHTGEVDTFDHTMKVMQRVPYAEPWERFAALCHDLGKALSENPPKHHGHDKAGLPLVDTLCKRLRVPTKYRRAAMTFTEEHIRMHRIQEMKTGKAVRLILKAEKSMTGGLLAFLKCAIGDGMSPWQASDIMKVARPVFAVRLPKKYHHRGKTCAEILNQLRCKAWRNQ